jgi:hypothetical protein
MLTICLTLKWEPPSELSSSAELSLLLPLSFFWKFAKRALGLTVKVPFFRKSARLLNLYGIALF